MTKPDLKAWLVARIARMLRLPEASVATDVPFHELGLESVNLLEISGELEDLLAQDIDPTLVYEHPTIDDFADQFFDRPIPAESGHSGNPDSAHEGIAIVGIGCRFPGANGPSELWRMLLEGRDMISVVPEDRWSIDEHYDPEPLAPGKMSTRWGGFVGDVDGFDNEFFRIPQAETLAMDPQQRMLLEVTWEALEDAGLPPIGLRGRPVGVFIGISHNDYEVMHLHDIEAVGGFSGAGNALSIAANRISYQFDFRGPSVAVDTACSSALTAAHLAIRSLRSGECDVAIVGGANTILSPDLTVLFSKAGMMSPDGRCKVFDESANGYVRGEGVGVVVLRRLTEAARSNDRIYGVIRGSAMSQDGRSNGLNAPNPAAQEAVLSAAYADARIDPRSVTYVEAHGTGTRLGDPIEARALGQVVGGGGRRAPCLVGSIKSNIGHLEAAAGIAGLIKGALIAYHGTAPASLHFHSPSPHIDFGTANLQVVTRPIKLDGIVRVGVSAFGFGGTNCHLVLEEAPKPPSPSPAVVQPELVLLSGDTEWRLEQVRRRWMAQLDGAAPPTADFPRIAQTSCLRRQHFDHRLALVAADAGELRSKLAAPNPSGSPGLEHRRACFIFPGQGSQYRGMALDLMDRFPSIEASLRESDRIVAALSGVSILDEIRCGDRLDETAIAQPAIIAVQLAIVEFLASIDVKPAAVIGHSVGEIAAACTAGMMSKARALELAVARGRAMSGSAFSGSMLAVRTGAEHCADLIQQAGLDLEIAAENAPEATVVAGDPAVVADFAALCARAGVQAVPLPVGYAFHSRRMEAAVDRLRQTLPIWPSEPAQIAMYSTVTGRRVAEDLDIDHWCANIRQPVKFFPAYLASQDDGIGIFVEIGPDAVLSPNLAALDPVRRRAHISAMSRRTEGPKGLLEAIGSLFELGLDIDLKALFPERHPPLPVPQWAWRRDGTLKDARLRVRERMGEERRPNLTPWLGQRIALPQGYPLHVWRAQLSSKQMPWLDDHRIFGIPVFPAAAMLVWMAQAVKEASGGDAPLQSIRVHEPLLIPDGAVIELTTKVDEASAKVEIHFRDEDGADWRPLCDASIHSGPRAAIQADLTAALSRCSESVPVEGLYDGFTAAGMGYGPTFRGLLEVRRGDDEAVATLRQTSVGSALQDGVEPWRLDGALQAIAAAAGQIEEGFDWVPMAVGKLEIARGLGEATLVHAMLRAIDRGEGKATADVVLADTQGRPMAKLSNVALSRMPTGMKSRLRDVGMATALHCYRDGWRFREGRASVVVGKRYLLLADRAQRSAALADALTKAGHGVVQADEDTLRTLGGGGAASLGDEALQRLVISIAGTGSEPLDGVICCWPWDYSRSEGVLHEDLLTLAKLVRSIALFGAARAPRLWLLTEGAVDAGEGEQNLDPWQATAWGLGTSVAFELPDLRCTRVDSDPAMPQLERAEALAALIAEDPQDADQFAIRAGGAKVRRISRVELGTRCRPLDSSATYVITGGWGALGLVAADAMVADGARHLLLIGRSAPSAAALHKLRLLEGSGVEIQLRTLDVADRASLQDALSAVRAIRPIGGVVHAAGVVSDGSLIDLTHERLREVLAGKALGAWNLHCLTQEDDLSVFVLFSSAAANLGTYGQSAYLAANSFLNALAHLRQSQSQPATAIEWGPWASQGMAAEAAGRLDTIAGVLMIDPAHGAEAFRRILADGETRLMVLPYGLESIIHIFPDILGISIFEEILEGDLYRARLAERMGRLSARPDLSVPYVAARTDLEILIAGIWQRALRIEPIGVLDPFFELGGDSVFAGQVLSEINRTLGVMIDSEAAFEDLTVEVLSKLTEEALVAAVSTLTDDEVETALARPAAR
jgi:acyl transferase domain-containing protein/acyl carrier protein